MNKVFTQKKQSDVGASGETDFKLYYSILNPIKVLDRDIWYIDFILNKQNNESVELKTDNTDYDSGNIYFDKWKIKVSGNYIQGPWCCVKYNVDHFVYYFKKNKTFIWFKPKPLVEFLDVYWKDNLTCIKEVQNQDENTGEEFYGKGYAVPKKDLTNLIIKIDEI